MFVRAVTLGFDPQTPASSGAGISLFAGTAQRDGDDLVYPIHGSVRIAAADIEVERMEILRGVTLTMIFSLSQLPRTIPLVATRVLFPTDVSDVDSDVVAGFRADVVIKPSRGAYYLHGAYRRYVSNVLRLEAPAPSV